MSVVKELTDANFSETIASGVTLVDLWAPWCGPCRIQGPVVAKVADSFEGRANVGKLEVDANPQTASKLGVSAIPTLILFKEGEEVQRFVGVQDEKTLTKALEDQLA